MANKTDPPAALRPLGDLKRWERNYRSGDVDAIVASIVRFGFNGVLRVWKGTVMAGNHLLVALETLKANGAKPPKGIGVTDSEWMVPCVDISHLSQIEAEAFAIADNRTQELGRNDDERLFELLEALKESEDDLVELAGYDDAAMEQLSQTLESKGYSGVPSEEPDGAVQMAFTLLPDQAEAVKRALEIAKTRMDPGEGNSNGRALGMICRDYVGQADPH